MKPSSYYYLLPPLDEKSTTQSGKVSYMARKDGNTDKNTVKGHKRKYIT